MSALVALALAGALAMPQPWGDLMRRDHVLVIGSPGCGKTPFASELAEGGELAARLGFRRAARRAVYWDAAGEWSRHGERIGADELEADPRLLEGVVCRVVVEPRPGLELEDFARVESACRRAAPAGGLVLLVDELGDLNRAGGEPLLRGLHRNGHKAGIATVFVSPCWTDIPARCRATASRVYSFFQSRDDDVRSLTSELGRQVAGFGELAAAWRFPSPPVAWVSPTLHS